MNRLASVAVVLAVLAIVLLPGLSAVGELDVREARDAQVVREMSERREWLTPILAREPYFARPAPGYALDALARRGLHGEAPLSRVVRAAVAALLALVAWALGRRAFGARAGTFAGIAFATMLGTPLAVRMDATQVLATTLSWCGIALLWRAVLDARSPRLETGWGRVGRWLGWVCFGLAGATAGPLAALWPLAGFALYAALLHERRAWRALDPFAGVLVIVGVMLPWYGAMIALHGRTFLERMAFLPYAEGALGGGLLLAITGFVVNAFPWTPLVGAAFMDEAQRMRAGRTLRTALAPSAGGDAAREIAVADASGPWSEHCASSLLLALAMASLVPVALYPSPPLTAALPALPAIAVLCGRFAARAWDDDRGAAPLLAGATRMTALVGATLAVALYVLASRVGDASEPLRHAAAGLLVAACAPLLAELVGRRRLAVALLALPVSFGAPFAAMRVLPAMEPWFGTSTVIAAMEAASPIRAPLVVLESPPPSLRLGLHRNLVTDAEPFAHLARWAARDGYAYVAFRPSQERLVARSSPAPLEILLRTPALVLARIEAAPRAFGPEPHPTE